jgi:hypothetical protein
LGTHDLINLLVTRIHSRLAYHSIVSHHLSQPARSATVAILAHQGGWDEVLLIGAPILVIAGLLVLAKRRVDAASEHEKPD